MSTRHCEKGRTFKYEVLIEKYANSTSEIILFYIPSKVRDDFSKGIFPEILLKLCL